MLDVRIAKHINVGERRFRTPAEFHHPDGMGIGG
jgi:hypothetical protein